MGDMGDERMDRETNDFNYSDFNVLPDSGQTGAGKRQRTKITEPKWVVAKLVLGILSFFLFVLVMFQSCAAGLGNALSENGEVGGSAGFLCSVNFLISGLIAVIARKSVKKSPMIVAAVLLWLNLFYAKIMAGSYSDLVIWGYLSFIFGLVYLFSVMRTRRQYLITGIVAAVFLALTGFMGTASGGGSTASSETVNQESKSDVLESRANDQESMSEQESVGSGQAVEGMEARADQQGQGGAETEEQRETSAESWDVGEGMVNVYTNSIGTPWVQIAVPVLNTGNTNLFLSDGTMDLEDENGHLIDSKKMVEVYPQVIKPGETAWYYEDTTLDEVPSSSLTVIPHIDVREAKVDCIRYKTSDISFAENYGIKVTGRVENTTDEPESMVKVAILMYDAEKNFLGLIYTYLDGELNAGDKMGFSAGSLGSNGNLELQDVANYRIYAYPTQFQF